MTDLTALKGATIAFDLDGTLVDTAPDLVATLNLLLGQEGLSPLPLAEARPMIGRGARALIQRGFAAEGVDLPDAKVADLFERFIDHYLAHIADHSRPFPGVEQALADLKSAGAAMVVCTNKRTDLSKALIGALGLARWFDAVVGPDAAGAQKPDKQHLLAAINAASGRPARSVMVGDAATDADVARAAGVPLILVSFGYTETPARDLKPDVLIDHFDELAGACARLLAPLPGRG